MGWFLTGPKKRKPKSTRKPAARQPWDPQRTWRGVQWMLGVCGVLAVVIGWRYADRGLRGYIARTQTTPVTVDHIQLADQPAWMSDGLSEDLRTMVAFELTADPLDAAGLQRAVLALRASPWVASVDRVERLPGGAARVVASYREPLALVEHRGAYYLVDREGVRLPQVYRRDQATAVGLTPIEGVSAALPVPGERWPGEEVPAALRLIGLLAGEHYFHQVKAVDTTERDTRGRLRLALRTDRATVRWGLPPGQEHSIEPPVATKLQWLEQVYRTYGSIDDHGRNVDLFRAAAYLH